MLPGEVGSDAERLKRFEQEARAAGALNHPNVLSVYDIGSENGAPYIVSELLEGQTLRERLQAGPQPLRKVVEIGAQIARGLAAAHEKGIVHRDLKPENVFLTKDERVKILDFGLAKLTKREETSPEFRASPTASLLTGAGPSSEPWATCRRSRCEASRPTTARISSASERFSTRCCRERTRSGMRRRPRR